MSTVANPPLERIVISAPMTDDCLASLRSEFPAIRFDVATPDSLATLVPEADAVLMGWSSADVVFGHGDRLRWVQNVGAGVERLIAERHIDERIQLTNGSGIMAPNMAEHILGLILAFARSLPTLLESQRNRQWKGDFASSQVFELQGQRAVMVGVGDIGIEVSKRLRALGVETIGVRRSSAGQPIAEFDRIVSIAEIDDVLGDADHVISSLPHTAETLGMFDAKRFERFKEGAYFYNVGRGTSVVQEALIEALESGKIAGAGLDVTTPEPLPADDPLWLAPNVIITSHTSGNSPKFMDRLVELFRENIRRYQTGAPLLNVVDRKRGY